MQPTEQKPLSFIDILTSNLFLFTVMCICIGFGVVIRLLHIDSLDTYIFQIKSDRLDFIFFIGVAACYLPLLFVLINRYWINFFVQLFISILLFVFLLFIFSPPLKVKVYLFNYHVEFSTRNWEEVNVLPVGKREVLMGIDGSNIDKNLFMHSIIFPTGHCYYFFSFVFSSYSNFSLEKEIKSNE